MNSNKPLICGKEFKNHSVPKTKDDDWGLNEIGHIYVINLPRDHARKKTITANLSRIGVTEFEFIEAVDGSTLPHEIYSKIQTPLVWEGLDIKKQHQGEAGIWLSHKKCIEDAMHHYQKYTEILKVLEKKIKHCNEGAQKQSLQDEWDQTFQLFNRYKQIIVFEDDTGFGKVNPYRVDKIYNPGILTHLIGNLSHANQQMAYPTKTNKVMGSAPTLTTEGALFRQAWKELPEDWDMLYLNSYNHLAPKPYSKHLMRLRWGVWLNAWILNSKMYQPVLDVLQQIEKPDVILNAVDDEIASLHQAYQCFVINPSIVYQGRTGKIGGQVNRARGKYEQMFCMD